MISKVAYKETEIGKIPEDWAVVELSELADIVMGQSPPSSSYNEKGEGLPFFQGRTDFGEIFPTPRKWCSSPSKVAEENDVLISVRAPVGDINMCTTKSCIGRGLGAVRAKEKEADTWFLYYLLQSLKSRFNLLGQGSIFTAINGGELRKLLVTKPSYREQQKIAQILSAVDEQIEKTKQLIEKTKELKKGLIQRLLSKGINHTKFKNTNIGIVPEDWSIVELSEMATIIMGQAPPSTSYNESGEGLPFFQGRTEFGTMFPIPRKWCTSPSRVAEVNNVLMSVRAPVGDVNMCNVKSCIGRGLGAIGAIEEVSDPWFLYYLLQSLKSRFNLLGQGSTFTAINGGDLRKLMVVKPKYEEQKKIAEILLSVDEQINCYEKEKEKQVELKKALMQQLLTGKLRVTV